MTRQSTPNPSRRTMLAGTAAALAAAGSTIVGASRSPAVEPSRPPTAPTADPFRFCFNTSTIRGQKLPIAEVVEIAAKAGWQAIEPWIDELDQHVKSGGSLADLGKKIADLGLTVESAIGFAEWIVDDDARRARGMEEAKRTMEIVQAIGGRRIAAPPAGATDVTSLDLQKAAGRFRALIELGEKIGVTPEVEVWGFSKSLSLLGETAYVALESRHPKALMLLDVYHLHKGGSGFDGLRLLGGRGMQVFHVNDYPASPSRETIDDSHRVYPGDGVAPLTSIFRALRDCGFQGFLSLELFNREYWSQDPSEVARIGLEKTRAAVAKSLS